MMVQIGFSSLAKKAEKCEMQAEMHFLGIWKLLVQQMGTGLMVKAAYGPSPYSRWITQLKHLTLPSLTFDPALNSHLR